MFHDEEKQEARVTKQFNQFPFPLHPNLELIEHCCVLRVAIQTPDI